MSIEWFAGLIDGEGCFSLSTSIRGNSILIEPYFSISMKSGNWEVEVKKILESLDIKYLLRYRKGQTEYKCGNWMRVKKLCTAIVNYSIVKKGIIVKLLQYNLIPKRNRYVKISKTTIDQIADLVDFVREFNKGKNRPYKWTGDVIKQFFNNQKIDD